MKTLVKKATICCKHLTKKQRKSIAYRKQCLHVVFIWNTVMLLLKILYFIFRPKSEQINIQLKGKHIYLQYKAKGTIVGPSKNYYLNSKPNSFPIDHVKLNEICDFFIFKNFICISLYFLWAYSLPLVDKQGKIQEAPSTEVAINNMSKQCEFESAFPTLMNMMVFAIFYFLPQVYLVKLATSKLY